MLTSKIVIEIIEKHYDFLDAWIAAINLFQVNLDKPWNYRWYCYEKQWCWRWGCRGCKRTPKSFDLLKTGKNGAQCCLTSKNGAQCLHENTRPYFGGYTKKKSSWSLWEKIYRQKLHKNFSGKFGEIRAKFCTPDLTKSYVEKIHYIEAELAGHVH